MTSLECLSDNPSGYCFAVAVLSLQALENIAGFRRRKLIHLNVASSTEIFETNLRIRRHAGSVFLPDRQHLYHLGREQSGVVDPSPETVHGDPVTFLTDLFGLGSWMLCVIVPHSPAHARRLIMEGDVPSRHFQRPRWTPKRLWNLVNQLQSFEAHHRGNLTNIQRTLTCVLTKAAQWIWDNNEISAQVSIDPQFRIAALRTLIRHARLLRAPRTLLPQSENVGMDPPSNLVRTVEPYIRYQERTPLILGFVRDNGPEGGLAGNLPEVINGGMSAPASVSDGD